VPCFLSVPCFLVSDAYSSDNSNPVTDGTHAQYFSSYESRTTTTAPNIWPIPIDVRHGVAAVVYNKYATERDETGNPSTTMLGCRCIDNAGHAPMQIMCALALRDISTYGGTLNNTNDLTFEVVFQNRQTAKFLQCNQVEISVQSVRWSSTRFTGSYDNRDSMDATCQSRGSCSAIDATIWVAPLCTSGSTTVQLQCISLFTGSSCYPYCMAARASGSGADGLVLYNAADWLNKVHVMDRDCGVETHLDDIMGCVADNTCSYLQDSYLAYEKGTVSTILKGDMLGGMVLTKKWDANTGGCVQSSGSVSILGTDVHTGYQTNAYKAILGPGTYNAILGPGTTHIASN
jgi:hypothetical protein